MSQREQICPKYDHCAFYNIRNVQEILKEADCVESSQLTTTITQTIKLQCERPIMFRNTLLSIASHIG